MKDCLIMTLILGGLGFAWFLTLEGFYSALSPSAAQVWMTSCVAGRACSTLTFDASMDWSSLEPIRLDGNYRVCLYNGTPYRNTLVSHIVGPI